MSYAAGLPFSTNANLSLAEQLLCSLVDLATALVSPEFCKSIYRVFTDFSNSQASSFSTAFFTTKIMKPVCVCVCVCVCVTPCLSCKPPVGSVIVNQSVGLQWSRESTVCVMVSRNEISADFTQTSTKNFPQEIHVWYRSLVESGSLCFQQELLPKFAITWYLVV